MALNAASHNATTTPTGSVSGPPPPVDDSVTDTIKKAARQDSTGQEEPGQDKYRDESDQTVMGESGKEKIAEEVHGEAGKG